MLKLTKKGDKYWLFEDSQIGLFSPSKFTINLELNEIVIVYENGLKSKRYNVSDCEIYDLGELTPFTTSSGDLFMQKLEELNCPCFQKNENIFNITGGSWGEITGTLSDQTDLQSALGLKLDKVTTTGVERAYIINADGSQGVKSTSEFKDVLEFANLAAFPVTGETGKIYLALDTNKTYRWSGSTYVQLSGGIDYPTSDNVLYGVKNGIATQIDSELHKSWYSIAWRKDAVGALFTNVNSGNYAGAGTTSLINASGVSRLTSFWATNFLSAPTAGAICGLRQQLTSETTLRSGYESYFIFRNNDTNVNAQTIMGFTSLVADFPNVAFSAYTGDFQGVGNDVGDTNLSFILKTTADVPNGVLASYTKIPLGSSFPAHTTSDVYMLKIEAPQTEVRANQFIKMTITNLINGEIATHTFNSSLCPFLNAGICLKMQRSARNSGIATNIGLFKFHFKHNLY